MILWIGFVLACITTDAHGEAPSGAPDTQVVRIALETRGPVYTF